MEIKLLFNKAKTAIKEHAPEILTVAGVSLSIGAGVYACHKTRKLDKVLDERKEKIQNIKAKSGEDEVLTPDEVKEQNQEIVAVNIRTGLKLAGMYAPSVIMEIGSVVSLCASNRILRGRMLGLAAAYTTVATAFEEYRGRVKERLGEEAENEIFLNAQKEKVVTTKLNENGEEETVEEEKLTVPFDGPRGYGRWFCRGEADGAVGNIDYDERVARLAQDQFNRMLPVKGVIYLNEVYEYLGIKRSVEGQTVGWVYDPERTPEENMIKFNIQVVDFKVDETGEPYPAVWLGFEPDGLVSNYARKLNYLTGKKALTA